jgi:hypothetical protein
MQKFKFKNNTPANVAKAAKAAANEEYPVANQLLKFANVIGSENGKAETLADISTSLAGQDTNKDNNLSKNSKISSTSGAILENNNPIQPPEPPGQGHVYESLWTAAWRLADETDNPDSATLAERKAKIPELNRLRAEMAEIERQAAPTAGPDPERSPPDIWHTWESNSTTRVRDPETFPAKDRATGKCYARAYFKGKPGWAVECEPDKCGRIIQMTSDTTGTGKPEQGEKK